MKKGKIKLGFKSFILKNMLNEEQIPESNNPALSCWVAFDWYKIETRPTKYGKYLICRKDGKIHWETWNGSGWAYNHNEIRYWAVIVSPHI
jgi:hypothetical protein